MAFMPQHERWAWTEASKVKASHQANVQRIRARHDLSAQGRRHQLAQATKDARDKLAAIEADDRQRLADRHALLEDQLFAPLDRSPAGQDLATTAATRAAGLTTPQECERLLQVAQRQHTTVLAAEVAHRAVELADADPAQAANYWAVIHGWADQVSGARDKLAELGMMDAEALDPHTQLNRSAFYRADTIPEIQGMNVDYLASQADETSDVIPQTTQQAAWARLAASAYNDSAVG